LSVQCQNSRPDNPSFSTPLLPRENIGSPPFGKGRWGGIFAELKEGLIKKGKKKYFIQHLPAGYSGPPRFAPALLRKAGQAERGRGKGAGFITIA